MTDTSAAEPAVAGRLAQVRARIASAAREHGRDPASIALVAVSKTKPACLLAAALNAGQRDFGENYLQDALPKIEALADHAPVWHFIGDIQSNKTRTIVAHFAWAHAVDRFKIARRLSEQRPAGMTPLNICIQVNIDGEANKAGVAPAEAADLAARITELDHVRLRGLMAIPAPTEGFVTQRVAFAALRRLRDDLNADGFNLDTLSMGMSADLEAAIAEGATHVRVGTAIFGAREYFTTDRNNTS
jgi:pyridoxal phosphate enzyme (YggS family)